MKQSSIKININGKQKFVNIAKKDNIMIGINSGYPHKQQYIFIDLDNNSQASSIKLAEQLVKEQKLRRALIIKSSKKSRYHIISFSPKPFNDMIEILRTYNTDDKHLIKALDNGFATLRITSKNNFKPMLITSINNLDTSNLNNQPNNQLNFYDFDMEKAYLKLLEK